MDLEEPDGDVDCEAQGPGVGGVVVGGEEGEGGAGGGAEFAEEAVDAHFLGEVVLIIFVGGGEDGDA